jgi:DNA invertase Pin-like site-specific DNA recombinase
MVEQLGSLGVDLISLGDPGLDTTGPSGRVLFHVLGAVAEFERDLIRERTRAGVAAARRRGRRLGRPTVEVPLERARALVAAGHSVAATARELGMSRSTLARALTKIVSAEGSATP